MKTSPYLGRPRLRRKIVEVDIDHCYSLPNMMPQSAEAAHTTSGAYLTRTSQKSLKRTNVQGLCPHLSFNSAADFIIIIDTI